MPIDTSKATTSMVENAWRWILSPSLSTRIGSSILAKPPPQHKQNDGVLWMWTAFGLSVYGLKLCKSALELYWVSLAYNHRRLQGRNDSDESEHELGPTKQSLDKRQGQIDKALTTMTFGQLQQQISEHGDCDRNSNSENTGTQQETKKDGPQNKIGCTNSAALSSSSTTTTTRLLHPPLEKTCVICLEDFETDDCISFSSNNNNNNNTSGSSCQHIFHKECLQAWLEKHTSCPTCRTRMLPDPDPMPWLLAPNR